MGEKIQIVKENNCYILKIFTNSNDALPFMLFHCSYIDRFREEALAQAKEYKVRFRKTYKIQLEEKIKEDKL